MKDAFPKNKGESRVILSLKKNGIGAIVNKSTVYFFCGGGLMNPLVMGGGLMFGGGLFLLLSLPFLGVDRRIVYFNRVVLAALVALFFVFGVRV